MKHTNKTLALVLVLVLMLTSVASVFAYPGKAYTSGGNLNIWSDPEKIGKGKDYIIKSVKNGTALEITATGKNKAGVKWGYEANYGGYVRLSYVASLSKTKPAKAEPKGAPVDVKVITSGGDLNIWTHPNKIGSGKVYIVDSVAKGDEIVNVQYLQEKQANGKYKTLDYAAVLNDKGEIIGYVRTKFIYAPPAAPKKADKSEAAATAPGTPKGKPYEARTRVDNVHLWKQADKIGEAGFIAETFKKAGTVIGNVQEYEDKKIGKYGLVYGADNKFLGYVNLDYVVSNEVVAPK